MSISLSDLAANLHHISFIVAKPVETTEIKQHLVPSLWGNRLYTNGITKRILVLIYRIIEKFLIPHYRERRFLSVMKKTFQSYQIQAEKLKVSLNLHERERITDWNNWMYPVLKNQVWKNLQAMYQVHIHIDPTVSDGLWITNYQDAIAAAKEQKILDVENQSHAFFPRSTLSKIARGEATGIEDEKLISNWIEALNLSMTKTWWQKMIDPRGVVSVRKLHHALQVFAEKINPDAPELTSYLELQIHRLGCKLLSQADEKHLRWREQLLTNPKITYWERGEEKNLEVERRLRLESGIPSDKNIAYSIKDDSQNVLVVGINEAILGINEQMHGMTEKRESEPPCATLRRLDIQGRFKVIERLYQSLAQFEWQSNGETIHLADAPIVASLVKMVKVMKDRHYSPQFFSPQFLYFDAENRLKTIHDIPHEPFNFNTVVTFLMDLGHPVIYKQIVKETDLKSRQESRCYSAVVENALKKEGREDVLELEEECLNDPRIAARSQKLDKEIGDIFSGCYQEIMENYKVSSSSDLEIAVCLAIKNAYEQGLFLGQLSNTFKEEVFKQLSPWLFSKKFSLKPEMKEKKITLAIDLCQIVVSPAVLDIAKILTEAGIFDSKQREEAQEKIHKHFLEVWS